MFRRTETSETKTRTTLKQAGFLCNSSRWQTPKGQHSSHNPFPKWFPSQLVKTNNSKQTSKPTRKCSHSHKKIQHIKKKPNRYRYQQESISRTRLSYDAHLPKLSNIKRPQHTSGQQLRRCAKLRVGRPGKPSRRDFLDRAFGDRAAQTHISAHSDF